MKLEPLVTGIELISDYTKGLTQEEIYSAWLEPGDYKIVYSKPYYDVVAEGVGSVPAYLMTEDNRAITTEDSCVLSWEGAYQYGVNHIFLHVVIAGNVVVRGYPWIASTRAFVYDEAEATKKYSSGAVYGDTATYGEVYYAKFWQVSAAPNVWKVEKATMVSADIAPDVFNMLIHFAKLRYRQNMTLFPRASIRPGHFKLVESLYQKGVNGIVTKITSKLTGVFSSILSYWELKGSFRMADPILAKISELDELTSTDGADQLLIVDASEPNVTKKTKRARMDKLKLTTVAQIADGIVTSSKLAAGAVTAGKIATGGVSAAAQMADGIVTDVKLASNSVTESKIASAAVTSGKIANGAVTSTKIADSAVTSGKIANGAVTSTKIADSAVTSGKIANGGVSSAAQIADGIVTEHKLA